MAAHNEDERSSSTVLTLEERYGTVVSILVHQYFQLYRVLGERFGWDVANEIAGEVPQSSVPLIVRGYQRKFGLAGTGAELLARVFSAEFEAEGSEVTIESQSEKRAEFEVLCSFGEMLQSDQYSDVLIHEGLCNRGCLGWMDRVGQTLDRPVSVERTRWMGAGASRCEFALQRETTSAQADR